MSTKILEAPSVLTSAKRLVDNDAQTLPSAALQTNSVHEDLPTLPTFPLEAGWRLVCDPITGEFQQMPLTLRDILFPTEEDIGAIILLRRKP